MKGKKLREAVAVKLGRDISVIHLSKGRAMVKLGYFYRPCPIGAWIDGLSQKLGSEFKIVDFKDHWAAWPKDSYYVAYIISTELAEPMICLGLGGAKKE